MQHATFETLLDMRMHIDVIQAIGRTDWSIRMLVLTAFKYSRITDHLFQDGSDPRNVKQVSPDTVPVQGPLILRHRRKLFSRAIER